LPFIAFWVFVIYVLWTIAQSLKSIDASAREIEQALKDRQ